MSTPDPNAQTPHPQQPPPQGWPQEPAVQQAPDGSGIPRQYPDRPQPAAQWPGQPGPSGPAPGGGRHSRALLIVPLVLLVLKLLNSLLYVMPGFGMALYRSGINWRLVSLTNDIVAIVFAVVVIVLVWLYLPPARFARVMVTVGGGWLVLTLIWGGLLVPALARTMAIGGLQMVSWLVNMVGLLIPILEIVAIIVALVSHSRPVWPGSPWAPAPAGVPTATVGLGPPAQFYGAPPADGQPEGHVPPPTGPQV